MICKRKKRFWFFLSLLFFLSVVSPAHGLTPSGEKRLIELVGQLSLEVETLRQQSTIILSENEALKNSIAEARADSLKWKEASEESNRRLLESEEQRIALERSLKKWMKYSIPVMTIEALVIIGLLLLL